MIKKFFNILLLVKKSVNFKGTVQREFSYFLHIWIVLCLIRTAFGFEIFHNFWEIVKPENGIKISLDCPCKDLLYYYLTLHGSVRCIRIRIRIRTEIFSWIRIRICIRIFSMRIRNTVFLAKQKWPHANFHFLNLETFALVIF